MSSIVRENDLLTALASMRIEAEGATLSFNKRLARDNHWGEHYTARVVQEYHRFLALAATLDHPVTPSDAVDEAWHLHLTYTRHYWNILCGEILKRPLHHDPTEGGADQSRHFKHQYAKTLAAYEATFGSPPPADIWPPADVRFGSNPATPAQLQRKWSSLFRWTPLAAIPLLAGCTLSSDSKETLVYVLITIVLLGLYQIVSALRRHSRRKRKGGDGCGSSGCSSSDSDSGDSSCGGGGCGGGD